MHYERLEMDGWPEKKIKMTFTSIFVAHHNNNFHICDLGKEAPKTNNQPLHFIHSWKSPVDGSCFKQNISVWIIFLRYFILLATPQD